MIHPWATERAAWINAHSDPEAASARRRSGILNRADRQRERAGTGVGVSAAQDEIPSPLWRRTLRSEKLGMFQESLVVVAAAVGAYCIGAGVALGVGAYRVVLLRISTRIGRLWLWPWALAAVLLMTALVLLDVPTGIGLHLDRHFPVSLFSRLGPWWAWMLWQLAVAFVVIAWQIRVWGWAGVQRGVIEPPKQNKDGSWRVVVDKNKAAALNPYRGQASTSAEPMAAEVPEPTAPEPEPAGGGQLPARNPALAGSGPDAPDLGDVDFDNFEKRIDDEDPA
ncbi:hypothetical protein [Gordonia neofelifaecis]|uniref:Uncharacterized protein n=1 Tax=Gordonia neofelifaecis NRRL B-59395 TaxID=644548 RepID=F1YE67_9ACTN|nr:hypothetical protein [Gordonia neofelifaecis]EGD57157.1 hypothetical protein SCNU_02245 [Gordonia neofelifaecis NRRL B-59395]